MKIWIEYQNTYSNGEKASYKVYFLDTVDEISLHHSNPAELHIWNSGKYRNFRLDFIDGMLIEPDETSEIEKRMAEHILMRWKKIGE